MVDQQVIGKMGRVTVTIKPGEMGEIMISVRGGSEAYSAYASEPDETLKTGTRVVVVEHYPPRTVVVAPM